MLNPIAGLPVTRVVALHGLNLAAMCCDRTVVLREAGWSPPAPPVDTLTEF
jgi:iron complex transport system ATP-binding protein